mgnify:CR=1 FL=1
MDNNRRQRKHPSINSKHIPTINIEKIKLQALGEGVENNWEHYAEAFINAVKKDIENIISIIPIKIEISKTLSNEILDRYIYLKDYFNK